MKITLTLFLVTLTTFSGKPTNIVLQKESYEQPTNPLVIEKINTDSANYFKAALKGDKLTYMLIAAKKKSDNENIKLRAEIKRLKLQIQNNTIIIHDTIFKKRKFFQLFKN